VADDPFGQEDVLPASDRDGACRVLGEGARSPGSLVSTKGLGPVLANAAITASVAVIVAGRSVAVRSRVAPRACGSITRANWLP
jgi:hypothetical protein